MSDSWRRYEILLPLQFNDGREIPTEWLGEANMEIVNQFGAASFETQKVQGQWRHGATLDRDNLVRLVVDIPESEENRRWMKAFQLRWQTRLGQEQLWMISHPIEVE